jgi:hypothetical protein
LRQGCEYRQESACEHPLGGLSIYDHDYRLFILRRLCTPLSDKWLAGLLISGAFLGNDLDRMKKEGGELIGCHWKTE